jgi:hypothetical protein
MSDQTSNQVARKFLQARMKTAGEVRFIKDRSGDKGQWAWGDAPPTNREITPDYAFNAKNIKPLAECLWSTTVAMGHVLSAQAKFTRIKSATVSPDGSLGGRGYIQKIQDMRRAYMNAVESLSALSDTLYDEIRAPHWAAISRQSDPEFREELKEIMDDTEEVKEDPKAWAEKDMNEELNSPGKKARTRQKQASSSLQDRVARRYLSNRSA